MLTVAFYDTSSLRRRAKGHHEFVVVISAVGTGAESQKDPGFRFYVDDTIEFPEERLDWLIGELQRVKREIQEAKEARHDNVIATEQGPALR